MWPGLQAGSCASLPRGLAGSPLDAHDQLRSLEDRVAHNLRQVAVVADGAAHDQALRRIVQGSTRAAVSDGRVREPMRRATWQIRKRVSAANARIWTSPAVPFMATELVVPSQACQAAAETLSLRSPPPLASHARCTVVQAVPIPPLKRAHLGPHRHRGLVPRGPGLAGAPGEDLAVHQIDLAQISDHDQGVEGVQPLRVRLACRAWREAERGRGRAWARI